MTVQSIVDQLPPDTELKIWRHDRMWHVKVMRDNPHYMMIYRDQAVSIGALLEPLIRWVSMRAGDD
jgi:hypothetical protein